MRKEHAQYFEAIEKHPRLLVGQSVPAVGKEGNETLKSAEDARDWQDAVKSLLVQEVRDRTGRALEEHATGAEAIHASIEMFQNNPDLVPGSQTFDVELANAFADVAKGYELRVDGKLQGFSIPVQPLIDRERTRLQAERAAKAAQAPAGGPAAPGAGAPPAAQQAPAEPPQAGIQSKAGSGEEPENYDTLFGTLGLSGLRI